MPSVPETAAIALTPWRPSAGVAGWTAMSGNAAEPESVSVPDEVETTAALTGRSADRAIPAP